MFSWKIKIISIWWIIELPWWLPNKPLGLRGSGCGFRRRLLCPSRRFLQLLFISSNSPSRWNLQETIATISRTAQLRFRSKKKSKVFRSSVKGQVVCFITKRILSRIVQIRLNSCHSPQWIKHMEHTWCYNFLDADLIQNHAVTFTAGAETDCTRRRWIWMVTWEFRSLSSRRKPMLRDPRLDETQR
jgi:hypothetical protein